MKLTKGMKTLIIAVSFLLFSAVIQGQENDTLFFTLEEAEEFAMENNLKYQNAQLDIQASEKEVWQTTATGLPQISGDVSYQHIPGELPTVNFGGQTASIYQYIFESLSQLGYPPPEDLMSQTESEPVKLGVKNSTTYSVRVSQLIFSGEYIVGLQASRTYLQISKINEEKQKINLKENILKSYITALILERNRHILESSMANIQSLLKETKAMAEAGFAESTDVDQLQLQLNTLENNYKSLNRQIDLSYLLFKIQLGAELDKNLVLTDDLDVLRNKIISQDEVNSSEFDVQQNVNYKLAVNQTDVSRLNLKRQKSHYLPNLSAFYQYQDRTRKPAFDFTINHTIGVNLTIPIFSSFQRRAQVQQAKIELEKAKNDKNLLEKNLRSQLKQAQVQYRNAMEKKNTAQENVALSQRIFKNTSKKYKEGMVSSIELTQTHNNYLQAQSDYINSLQELLNAKIELEKILNEL